jgi:chromosomal replication initiation ATPase DnaA
LNNLSQLTFSFQTQNIFREEDFILLPENSAAVKFLEEFSSQKDFSKARFPSLQILGAKSCGKTHLINIFAQKSHAEFLDEKQITNLNLHENKFYIFENIDDISDEELLLYLINSASESRAFLLLTTRGKKFNLKDLASRLKNIFTIELQNPSIESITQLLVNGFARKQIKLSSQVINFIANNIDRTCDAAANVIREVEAYAEENGKNVTIKNIGELFNSSKKTPEQS